MGFLDKMKGAVAAITGGAAKVSLEYHNVLASPGDLVAVKVTAASTGAEVTSKGVFIDLRGTEEIDIPARAAMSVERRALFLTEFRIGSCSFAGSSLK